MYKYIRHVGTQKRFIKKLHEPYKYVHVYIYSFNQDVYGKASCVTT